VRRGESGIVSQREQDIGGESGAYRHGIRENLGQFSQQLLQVFFVGLTTGLQRNVVPARAEAEFCMASGSFILLMAFIISFGFVKGAMNFVAGRLSERVGRRKVLLWGWFAAIPIPFIIHYGPSWDLIVAANILLGINQGFAWSMTVTSKVDITRAEQRGLATGFNEFANYGGVAIAGLVTGYLAADFDPRMSLFIFGLAVIVIALDRRLRSGLGHPCLGPGPRPRRMTLAPTPDPARAFLRMCRRILRPWKFLPWSPTATACSRLFRRLAVSRNSSMPWCGRFFRSTCWARA